MKSVMPVEVGIMLFIKPISFFSHHTRYLMGTPLSIMIFKKKKSYAIFTPCKTLGGELYKNKGL